jgi:hypothetical protein
MFWSGCLVQKDDKKAGIMEIFIFLKKEFHNASSLSFSIIGEIGWQNQKKFVLNQMERA